MKIYLLIKGKKARVTTSGNKARKCAALSLFSKGGTITVKEVRP